MTRFTERVERDLDRIADRATPSSTAWEAIQQRIDEQDTTESTVEVIMLSPDRNQLPERRRTGLLVAASVVAIALIGGLIVVANRNDVQPADPPVPTVPVTVPVDATYPAGNGPFGVESDGISIWITNEIDSTVSKMNPADGTRVDYPTGAIPRGLAFDGTSIWIANSGDSTVSKMNPDDGTRVDYPTGASPVAVAFDGTSIWTANVNDDTVSKVNPDDGTRVDYATEDGPRDVVSDGTSIWIANSGFGTVSKMNPADGTRVDYPVGDSPRGVAFDGTSIWITTLGESTVSKMNPADGTTVEYPTGNSSAPGPMAVTFDGTSIWITNVNDNSVSQINPADGTKVDYPTGNLPRDVVFDGTSIWVTNFEDDTVSRIVPGSGDIEPDPGLINTTSIFDGDTCTYSGPDEFNAGSEVAFTLVDNSATRRVGFSVWQVAEQTTPEEILDEGIFRTNGEQIPESAPAVVTDTGIQVTYLLDRPGFYALNCADRPDGLAGADHATLFTVVG